MSYDKDLVRKNMLEINNLLAEVCDELPAGSVPSLEIGETLHRLVMSRKDIVQLSVKLIVNREPETF
ncbi:hypothetical protein NVP1271B_15 [Vibrio phage 1.271.B._10N.286.54.B4]|nr:hypothetical protein NVP1027O_15 [Vibrio phage 1.027.O._10N.286.54.B8]AUR92341.1 hypothetical protein NVP1171O_14 [Vibrio phage 1.171.O._10N.261.52.F12]AUR94395.1 hypothetical protein NVP1194O_15 [Vibrio phage 1.194.O._10N.286.54.B1]AUR95035.1 hypothetical protein NVP1200O_15 [Vibrio phage 1.200.O._10N.286.55.E1]AUR99608.1 hypothetical protein NVP1268A_15 [Vibrio phage 1.268.A._10N.286.54.A11]AUR99693.1 hypothetical protein NVP1268B_15 [Vibrio phage 1.268.B._10N.286.54.A11]AUR99866.1 hypot